MGKKSAYSKGYRKQVKQKKELTPQQKRWALIGSVAAVVILIAAIAIPKIVENARYLRVKNGVVQGTEENWVLANLGTKTKPKYLKVAQIGDVPAPWVKDEKVDYLSDENLRVHNYSAEGDSPINDLKILSGSDDASELAERYTDSVSMLGEITYQSDVVEQTIDGRKTYSVLIEYIYVETQPDGKEVSTYYQSEVLYIESPIKGVCVMLLGQRGYDSPDQYQDRDAITAAMVELAGAIEME